MTCSNGQEVEYSISTTPSAPTNSSDWQTETTFAGLSPSAAYYIFARAKGNDCFQTGAASPPLSVSTAESSMAVAPQITTDDLPNGTYGVAYSTTIEATGTAPIYWTVTAGNLPNGLSLNSTTGVISGKPDKSGEFTFTVKASNDALPDDTKQFTVTVESVADIVVNVYADAYVHGGNAALNYGDAEELVVKNDGTSYRRISYLKFVIPENVYIGTNGSAWLSLYLRHRNTGVGSIQWVLYEAGNGWTEKGITFNNRPDNISEITRIPTTDATVDNRVIADITSFIKTRAGQTVTICIDGSATNGTGDASFYSKEAWFYEQFLPQIIIREGTTAPANPGAAIALPEPPEPPAIDYTLMEVEHAESILDRIRQDRLIRTDIADLNSKVDTYIAALNTDGSFKDITYNTTVSSTQDPEWLPLAHLDRLREMAIAYITAESKHYESETLYNLIANSISFWATKNQTSTSWWYNRIACPQRFGEILIAMHYGKIKIEDDKWRFKRLIDYWNTLGRPDLPNDATTAGANKCDIAMHWIFRSALTRNADDMEFAVEQAFLPVSFVTGEGIQHDWSFRQHGAQLYLAGYGYEFVQLVTREAYFLVGTPYAMSGEKLDILSGYVTKTYLKIMRGENLMYNMRGRGVRKRLFPCLAILKI